MMKSSNDVWTDEIILAGDVLTKLVDSFSSNARLGPGLTHKGDQVVAHKSGLIKFREPDLFWIDYNQKRYVACKNDCVIGVVTNKQGDFYRVDIGASDQATLNSLSFEGASKRYRPNVQVGDLIFGKLVVADRDVEPELSCVDPGNGKAKGMGILQNAQGTGFMFRVSLNLARKILSTECNLLTELGSRLPFEVTIGMNGFVFVAAANHKQVLVVMDVIMASELLDNEGIRRLLGQL